jgi:hypothetical protein
MLHRFSQAAIHQTLLQGSHIPPSYLTQHGLSTEKSPQSPDNDAAAGWADDVVASSTGEGQKGGFSKHAAICTDR